MSSLKRCFGITESERASGPFRGHQPADLPEQVGPEPTPWAALLNRSPPSWRRCCGAADTARPSRYPTLSGLHRDGGFRLPSGVGRTPMQSRGRRAKGLADIKPRDTSSRSAGVSTRSARRRSGTIATCRSKNPARRRMMSVNKLGDPVERIAALPAIPHQAIWALL